MELKRSVAAVLGATLILGALTGPAAAQPDQWAASGLPPLPAAGPYLTDSDRNKLMDNLEAALDRANPHDPFDVIVRLRESTPTDRPVHILGAPGVTPRARWTHAVNGYAARLTKAQILALRQDPEVVSIQLDAPVRTWLNTATYWTGVQAARSEFGITGNNDGDRRNYTRNDVVVAVIDTGIDNTHADLAGGKVIGWVDVVNGLPIPYDDQGHGTHVASIVAGTGAASGGRFAGVAPGAALVGVKVMDGLGGGTESGVISGIDWVIANKARFNIRVANMSLGGGVCADGTDALSVAVDRAVDAGIVMVVANGNSGPGDCTVGSPAAAQKALAVGAVYDPGEKGWALAEFSSRGPTKDGRIKPEVAAPGRNINAAKANSGNQYVVYSGTSMASPFAAGVVALMLAANPGLTVDGVKDILYRKVKDFGPPGMDREFGHGIILGYDAVAAARGVRGRGWSDGLKHGHWTGDLGYAGAEQNFSFRVSSTRYPMALGLQVHNWKDLALGIGLPAFQLELYDSRGRLAARSNGAGGQETILFQPRWTGTYSVKVKSIYGDGSFHLDASYR